MQHSLTIVLCVKNAQSTLAATVQEILDVGSELSEQIELLIIDDGSTDATSEVATELMRHFPQIRTICLGRSLGPEEAIRIGLQESTGQIVLLHEDQNGQSLDEIVKNWKVFPNAERHFFRADPAKEREKIQPSQHYSSTPNDSELYASRKPRHPKVLSRPIRPNFLVRRRDNALEK
ncbi:MAG: glycosyltransferase family 2 protein [Thermoguttaceae bacterium]